MPQILPFKGLHFNPEKIKDISKVVSPPYDIISAQMQEELYKASPCNIVRIILDKILSEDNENNNRYTRAAQFFSQWQKEQILIQDSLPAVYTYEYYYMHKGEKKKLTGFMAICKLEELGNGSIKPHEMTFRGPIEDRLKLMKACMADTEPIYCLHTNPEVTKIISDAEKENLFDFQEGSSKRHIIKKITKNKVLRKVTGELAKSPVYIADGHHRYTTALEFSKEMHAKTKEQKTMPYDYMMMLFADINDSSILVMPTHRIIPNPKMPLAEFLENLKQLFIITEIKTDSHETLLAELAKNRDVHALGLCTEKKFYIVIPKDENIVMQYGEAGYGDSGKSVQWNLLDVSILSSIVIKHCLKMETHNDNDILYTRDAGEAIAKAGTNGIAFLLNPTHIQDVKTIADLNETMPHKSTYFFPKPLSGLVIYRF